MVEIRLVKYSEGAEQLSSLFRLCFKEEHMTAEDWNWKYLQNPLSQPEVIGAIDDGRIVGGRPFWFIEMWLQDKTVKTAQHCDTMVHPDYRGRGIFNKMGQFAIHYLKDNGYALSYGFPGLISRPGFFVAELLNSSRNGEYVSYSPSSEAIIIQAGQQSPGWRSRVPLRCIFEYPGKENHTGVRFIPS